MPMRILFELYIFVEVKSVTQFRDFINAANFDIKDKDQVDTCKSLLYAIKQTVLLNKNKAYKKCLHFANIVIYKTSG